MAETLTGFAAAPGRAYGPTHLVRTRANKVARRLIDGSQREAELTRLEQAADALVRSLEDSARALSDQAPSTTRSLAEALLTSQRAVLDDPVFIDGMRDAIRERNLCAEWAVESTLSDLQHKFRRLADERFRSWFHDVQGLAEELLRELIGACPTRYLECDDGDIVVAHSLTISDTINLIERGAAGFVLERGSLTSHVAVLCRSAGIAAVTGIAEAAESFREDQLLMVDGDQGIVGVVVHRPDNARQTASFEETLPAPVAPDGTPVILRANLELRLDAQWARAQGTQGVGLWRTFFQYIGRSDLPTEQDLSELFGRIVEDFAPEPVHIRLLDLSGPFEEQELPAELRNLGPCRGIRLRQHRPDVLTTQIRAIVRAASRGDVRVLVPFVTDVSEMIWVRQQVQSACAALNPQANVAVGAMIEVPAAVLAIDAICEVSDHLAIGSNDLGALLLGFGREEPRPPGPPPRALLDAIATVVQAANRRGIAVSLCGELASDLRGTRALMATGLRQLSLTPRLAPGLRFTLHELWRRTRRAEQARGDGA